MPMLVANDKKLSQTEIVALISKLQGNFGSQTALKETIYRLAETGHPFAIAAICQCITDPKCGGLKAEEAWTALVNYPSKRAIANLRDALERGQKLSPPKRGSAEDALEKLESKLKSGNAKAEKPFMKTAASGGKQASAPMEKPLTQEECIKILNSPAETPEAQREQARAVVSLFGSVGPNKKESYTELDFKMTLTTELGSDNAGSTLVRTKMTYNKDVLDKVFNEIFNASLSEYDVVINEATERFKMRIKTNEGMLVIYNVFEQGTPEEKVKAIECLRDSDTLTVAPGEPMAVRFMLLGMRDKSPEVRGFAAESLASFISMKPHQNAYRGDYEFYLERGKVLQRDIVQSASFGERSIFMVRKNSPYDVLPTIAEAIRAEKDPEVKAKMQEALSSIRDSAKTYSRRRFAFEYKMLEIGVRIDIWNLEEKKIDEMQEFSETSEFEEMKRKHGDGFDEYVLERFKVKDSKEFKELDKDKNLFKDDFSESLVKLVKKYSIEGNWDHLRYKENGERLLSEQNVKRVEERIKK